MDKAEQKEILVVDDTSASLQLLTGILTARGYRVRPASSGALALRSVAAKLPELILLDVRMPDMDGFEVCRRLKADEKTLNIPVLFISAADDAADKIRGFEAGAVDYITKPFQAAEVAARVGMHLHVRDLTKRLEDAKESLEKRVEARTAELAGANAVLQAEIAERKRAEETLQLMKFSVDHASIAAHLLDQEGRFLYLNEQMCDSLGYSRDELLRMNITDIDPDFPREKWDEAWAELRRRGSLHLETRHRRKDGSIFPVEITANYLEFSGKEYNWAFAQDITERKRTETELKRSYHLIKTIIDSMNDAISLIDARTFTIIGVNSFFLKEYGFSDDSEVVGKHCYEITHHRNDVCTAPDDICPLMETVKTGGHSSADHIHYGRQGEKLYAEVSTSPITDENGNVIQVVHVSRDITERKLAEQERERLLENIARSNKELEQFAYVASHDLQEPLRMVASYVNLLERKYRGRLDEQADKYIHFSVDGAKRMQRLIDGLLAYSRVASRGNPFAPVDLNGVFEDAVTNLAAAAQECGARITRDDLPAITGDETQMLQLFQNLIANAIKFRKADMRPEIHIAAEKKGSEWTFSVRDNGIGIEPEYYGTVFQIFQRLHSQQEYAGTGIGLAVCKKIVERHRGRIWVESAPDRGATFFFTVPVAKAVQKAA